MKLIWQPLAALGGRSFAAMREQTAADCGKSIGVGLLCLVSVSVIGFGHLLLWQQFAHLAHLAPFIAAGVACLFLLLYAVALRVMETMAWPARSVIVATLLGLMGVNAALAGHEIVLLVFRPQVEEQALRSAASGVTSYANEVEASLGLPQLRNNSQALGSAVAAAQAERSRMPENVLALQHQHRACDAKVVSLQKNLPALDDPAQPSALSTLRTERNRCNSLARQAVAALTQHQVQADQRLAQLNQQQGQVQHSLAEAHTRHEQTLQRDTPTITAGATTGFARHKALWAAVAAGRIPAWAAYGLMFGVLAIDAFAFLLKLLARDDAATQQQARESNSALLYHRLHTATQRQQRAMVRKVVHSMAADNAKDLAQVLRAAVAPATLQDLEGRAIEAAATTTQRTQGSTRKPAPALLRRLASMAGALRNRRQAGRVAAAAVAA